MGAGETFVVSFCFVMNSLSGNTCSDGDLRQVEAASRIGWLHLFANSPVTARALKRAISERST
jgi:hypothetical protein